MGCFGGVLRFRGFLHFGSMFQNFDLKTENLADSIPTGCCQAIALEM